jgi:hypothetical protein
MMNIGQAFILVFFWLAVAGYLLLAVELFARAIYGLISPWRNARQSVEGPEQVNRPDGREKVKIVPWTARIVSIGRRSRPWVPDQGDARPPQEPAGVKARATNSLSGEAKAA